METTNMAIVRYNPYGGVSALQSEINRLFSSFGDNESTGATASWVPNVDIEEYTDRFHLYVDLPGVNPADVEITLDNGVLTISGERRFAAEAAEQKLNRRVERVQGQFYRRFALPDTVDADNVRATGVNGVLEIRIPKQAKAQPRRIEVAA
jgi:HSP20 family protein